MTQYGTAVRSPDLGLRVLLVEDDIMMSMMVEDVLTSLGCTTIAAASVAEGARLAATQNVDVALLDVNITGQPVYPVAQVLRGRGIPFIFATAYVRDGIPGEYRSVLRLAKPFHLAELESALRKAAGTSLHMHG